MSGGLFALLVGCAPRSAPVAYQPVAPGTAPGAMVRQLIVPGGMWREPGGLCLPIPEDWLGTAGPAPHLLRLRHKGTGVHLDLFAYEPERAPTDARPGWVLVFSDVDHYRTVPLLDPLGTATWRQDAAVGPIIQAWRGELDGRLVALEATFPFGGVTVGMDAVKPLLFALCAE